jgi:flagellar basal-body rod protein FlgB
MDFISTRPMEVTTMALDALSTRNKLLAANVANADTANYSRVDLNFEGQLQQIVQELNENDAGKGMNNSTGIRLSDNSVGVNNINAKASSSEDEILGKFNPEMITTPNNSMDSKNNNVNLETEMAEVSKNGMKYTAVATLQERIFRGLQELIRGAAT